MVKISKEASQKNRTDLLLAAGQMIREHGLLPPTVATIAAKADLTHGAIYRHFPSKEALAAAAVTLDFERVTANLAAIKARSGNLIEYLTAYLAEDHRDYFFWGCPVAPLAADIGRADPAVRSAFCIGLTGNLDAIAELSGIKDAGEAQDYAMATLALLSGAMAMARATKACDPVRSRKILQAALETLLGDPRLKKV